MTERTLCSKDDSSSSEEPPSVNLAADLRADLGWGMTLAGSAGLRVVLGVRERHDEATGEKPCTMDPLRMRPSEDMEVSELRCSLWRCVLIVAVVVLERHDSVDSWRFLTSISGSVSGCGAGVGVCFSDEAILEKGGLASSDGDRGPRTFSSCILATIFSRVTGLK